MSLDTVLNLVAVMLALAAAIGAIAAYRKSLANSQAIAVLPPKMAPTQEALDKLTKKAEAVAELLRADADRLQEYQNLLKENAQLNVANGHLRASIESKEGQIVHLTNILQLVNGLNERHQATITKQLNINAEYARNVEEMRKLIERLTEALDAQQEGLKSK